MIFYTFQKVQKRTFLFAPNVDRAKWYCRRAGLWPGSRNVVVFSGNNPSSYIHGYRVESWDEIVVLEDFWLSRNAAEIEEAFTPCLVDTKWRTLRHIPVVDSRRVA